MQMPPFDYFALSLIYGQWPKGAAKGALLPAIFPTHTTDRFSSGFPTLFREYCARHV